MTRNWSEQDISDLSGKVVVITGANSGLGFESARTLAGKGATVVMAVRSLEKGSRARADILRQHPDADLDVMALDNADLASVEAFANAFKAKYDRLDILLNNAGVMALPRRETADGFEMQLGVNHLAHFALTAHLLDVLAATPGARIHNVSSSANFSGSINFDDLMGEDSYSRWAAYGQSKLANVLFSFELQKRLDAAGLDIMSNSSHPGLVMTNLQSNSIRESNTRLEGLVYRIVGPLLAQDITMGVLPMLYAVTADDAKGGTFYGPRRFNVRGYPAEKQPNKAAYDEALRRRFWQVSEELTGVTFAFERVAEAAAG